ncbi:hypothetical protein L905_15510 [Agrobacterium sp. TS43]|nr:hypothetical protein L904_08050 [Agrobacterium sp. LY4]KVK44518.1 hypothetical protein L903_09555 [Agrobacterium sp. JL28]KVK68131.1 hypothetical protein L905_15510 [Agrobacterium sp. TS43]
MIATIYQCDADRGPLQPVYQLQTAEASTHDDNMMFLHMSSAFKSSRTEHAPANYRQKN